MLGGGLAVWIAPGAGWLWASFLVRGNSWRRRPERPYVGAVPGSEDKSRREVAATRRRGRWRAFLLLGLAVVLVAVPLVLAPRYLSWSDRLHAVRVCRGPVLQLRAQQTREAAGSPYVLARCLWSPARARRVIR